MQALLVVVALAATPLTLEEVRQASRQSLDAIRATLDVTRAESATKTSRSFIMPQVDLTLGAGVNFVGSQRAFNTVPVFDPATGALSGFEQRVVNTQPVTQARYSLGLSVTQLLYDGGRWWNQIAQSGAQEDAARGQLQEQQLASELEATRRFYELVKAQLALKVFQESVSRTKQQLERASALYEAGRGQRSAVYDAKTSLANDEINVVRQKQRVGQARLALLQWLGRSDADVEAVVPAELAQPTAPVETARAIEVARKTRPLFKSLDANVRAGELGVSVSRADYFPRISASAQYNRQSPDFGLFFDPTRQNVLSLGLNLSWDLFSGFQHVAQEERARADLAQAQAVQRQSIVDLEAEIARANEAWATEVEVLGISERNLDVAKEQAALEEERFNAGAGSSLEVRNAQIKFIQAQLSVLQGRADVATARAALERAVGGSP
ncbi:MAG: TolC family protein [Myxococcota bacterium]